MMAWLWRTWLLAWLALACLPARADTALSVYQSFRGTVNFTGTEVTLRSSANGSGNSACLLVSNNTASAVLKGIPSGATVLSAQLYWAGSGNTVDSTVSVDGTGVTAGRTYQSNSVGNGYNYFSAAADITTAVKQKGNGTYTFSGLNVSTGSPWCDAQGVVAGFALVVVYSATSEPFRMLNIYEGFQYFQYNGLTINLGNFNVPNPLPSTVTGRIGHITWEGDATLSGGGESLLFNNVELTDSMNPSGNQFNSQSNINGDAYSYGVDFDAYTLSAANGTIQPGQSSATTTYKTGQDMVLLSAEVVAMPYVANADLSLSMTRSGDLTANATASYTLSVVNNGIDTEVGPVTVVDTLPSGLKLVSTAGSGWSCTSAAGSNSTTIVTCAQNGPLAPSATMSALTLNVTATASANYTNSATVSGKTGDNNSANNTATNTYTMPSGTYGYSAAFTREACTNGQPIVVLASDTGCHTFTGPVTAGANGTNGVAATNIYITGVTVNSSGKQVATALASSSTTVPIDFMTSCLPTSGIKSSYVGLALDCKGTYQTANVTVSANQATATNSPVFFYADVGRVTLSARYQGTVVGSITFISRPYDIRVRDVVRPADTASDAYSDQSGVSPNFTKPEDIGFVKSGAPFTLRLGAMMANSTTAAMQWAPSFGLEPVQLKGAMDPSLLNLQFQLDEFAVSSPQTAPVLPVTSTATVANVDSVVQGAFVINQGFAVNGSVVPAGAMDASVSWFEAGNLAITPGLSDYLGTGPVGGLPAGTDTTSAARLVASTRVIGRFYPDHFETNADAKFDCLPAMNCPAAYDATKGAWPVSGGVYTSQPFNFYVLPYGLPRAGQASPLKLFQNVAGTSNRGTVLASAVSAPNGATALAGFTVSPALPVSSTDFAQMSTTATMKLPPAFDPGNRLAGNWGAPTFFYLRASMKETRWGSVNNSVSPQTLAVTSIAPSGAAAGTQYEDGLLAVNGRLQVANALGSEMLRLPVALTAQYWSGSAWLTNSNDSDSLVAAIAPTTAGTAVPTCTRALASNASGACKSGVVTSTNSGTAIRMNNGKATLVLQQAAPGRLNGSIDYQVSGGVAADWLPSTRARATFGLYKAPVIYLREVY